MDARNLIENARISGEYLLEHLGKVLENKGRGKNLRGVGLHLVFDLESKEKIWQVAARMMQKGVHVNVTNQNIIQIQPSLISRRNMGMFYCKRFKIRFK